MECQQQTETQTLLAKQFGDSADKTDDLPSNIYPQDNKESEDEIPDLKSAKDDGADTTPAMEDTKL